MIEFPSLQNIIEVLLLQNYNTRLVVLSTSALGLASGLIGTFLLLRKRSLMGDTLSHACLPGIGLVFILQVMLGGDGKYLPGLLLGASATGLGGVALVLAIRNTTRLKDDTAMGIVLSVFFGMGVAILGMIQNMPSASAAGLEHFIYGKTASMVWQDFVVISVIAMLSSILSLFLLKEFSILCFDEGFARSQGWPVTILDIVLLTLVSAVTVVGLQAVGLILIIAFLIIPAAAARFWTNNLRLMLILAGSIGAVSGWMGATISALLPRLPAGAVIVLVAATIFLLSMVLGRARGVMHRFLTHLRLQRKVGLQDLLRSVYEILESKQFPQVSHQSTLPAFRDSVRFGDLINHRAWTLSYIRRQIRRAQRNGLIEYFDEHDLLLSEEGFSEAERITRNHRLWEMYLIQHADIAPYHVDRDADLVEHILGDDLVRKLEEELVKRRRFPGPVPPPPDIIEGVVP